MMCIMVSKTKKPARKARAAKAKKTATAAPAQPPVAPKKVQKVQKAKASTKASTPVVKAKEDVTLSDAFVQVLGQLTSLRSQLTNITGQVRALQLPRSLIVSAPINPAHGRRVVL